MLHMCLPAVEEESVHLYSHRNGLNLCQPAAAPVYEEQFQTCRLASRPKSEMCDHHEREYKHKKTSKSKSQHGTQHHLNQGHRHHRGHNTDPAEDTNDLQPNHQNQHDYSKNHHPHHGQHKKNHQHVSVLESTNGSTSTLSSSSLSSSSSSSSLTTSSSSSSSFSTSSMSSSSSSLSSETSSEFSDRYHPRRPQHSQSFSDISGKHKYFEEDDDTAPLINARGNINRSSAKQKQVMGKSSSNGPAKGDLKNKQTSTSQQGTDGSFRKAKSMEDLPAAKDGVGNGTGDGGDQENSTSEAKKNFLKEKMKFSAFLNEITRQVLSPMRLSSLGVMDAHSPGHVSPRSRETDSSTEKPRRRRSRPVSPESVCSSKHSHSSRRSHSSRLSYSKSFHHYGHRSSLSPTHMKHRPRNSHSWSPTPDHQSHLPSRKKGHIHHHEDYPNPRHPHHHGYHHTTNHPHSHPHSPPHQDHHSPLYYNTSHSHEEKLHKDHYSQAHLLDEHRGGSQCQDHHCGSHHDHAQTHKDNYDPSYTCGGHHIKPHQHGDHHSSGHHHHNNPNSRPTTPCRHGPHNPTSNQDDHVTHEHQHGDHHREPHHHYHGIHKTGPPHLYHQDHHHSQGRHPLHKDQSTEAMHQYGVHKKTHYLHHKHLHSPSNLHHSQHHHSKSQNDLQDHHSPGQSRFLHGDHRGECFIHYNKNLHRDTHHHHHSGDHHHHHGDHPSTSHHHHHRNQPRSSHHYHHGNQHREADAHLHEDYEAPHHCCGDQCSPGHYYHHGTQQSDVHHHHHGDQHSPGFHHHHGDQQGDNHKSCHKHLCGDYKTSLHPESHQSPGKHNSYENCRLDDKHTRVTSSISVPSHKNPVSKDSPSNTNSPSNQEEEPPSQEETQEPGRVVILQDQNEGLHQSLLKTAVRMECLGEEFISSQKVLETELQRTRMELSNLMERFKSLQDDCSSTQQTNSLLEQRLHFMLQNMEGERERLNWRISELTEQLTDVKIANTMEEINADDALTQAVPPIAPPPAQFMDDHNYEKEKSPGQELPLGSVPEEEESDWSEMGEETPRLILTGANRGQTCRHQESDMDKDSESGSEEIFRRHSPYPLQIPHLQFTIHEFLPPAHTSSCPSGFKNLSDTACQNLKSAILIRSASLEEIPLARHSVHKELRGTEAVMNLHHSADEAAEDLDNEILHHWRMRNDRDTVIRRLTRSRGDEVDSSMAGLHSAEQLLKHLICDSSEGAEPGRAEVHVWTGGISDEALNVERTQL